MCPPDTYVHWPMQPERPLKTLTLVTSELVTRRDTGKRLSPTKVCVKPMSKSHRYCFNRQMAYSCIAREFAIITENCRVVIVPNMFAKIRALWVVTPMIMLHSFDGTCPGRGFESRGIWSELLVWHRLNC